MTTTSSDIIRNIGVKVRAFATISRSSYQHGNDTWSKYRGIKHTTQSNYVRKRMRDKYIKCFTVIAKLKYISELFKYIRANFSAIFSFNKKIKGLIQTFESKRIEMIGIVKECLDHKRGKYSHGQIKYLLYVLHQLKRELPQNRYCIANVLNRIFIKDVALYITEYL
jgi:hypothetical protein